MESNWRHVKTWRRVKNCGIMIPLYSKRRLQSTEPRVQSLKHQTQSPEYRVQSIKSALTLNPLPHFADQSILQSPLIPFALEDWSKATSAGFYSFQANHTFPLDCSPVILYKAIFCDLWRFFLDKIGGQSLQFPLYSIKPPKPLLGGTEMQNLLAPMPLAIALLAGSLLDTSFLVCWAMLFAATGMQMLLLSHAERAGYHLGQEEKETSWTWNR